MLPSPRDNEALRLPISVKGVIIRDKSVVLLENERAEWELPGGKLELDESPETCVTREIAEELQLNVQATSILDSWVYSITEDVHVLIVTYGCVENSAEEAMVSSEHKRLRWFPLSEVPHIHMPPGYKASIVRWSNLLGLTTA